jgi:hypothetical protein
MWHVPLLGNDREISKYPTAVTRQRPVNTNRGKVFPLRSVPRCYNQYKLEAAVLNNRWSTVVVSCCCEKLVAEAGESSGIQKKGNV